MRSIPFLSFLAILSFTIASAAAQPSTVDSFVPATQSGTSILILPFSSPPGNELYRWVGPAIQHVIAADVSHGSRVLNVLAPASAQPADDADAALSAGRTAGASFVVFGQTQLVEREVRLTGEVMDVSAGRSIGGLKATGKLDDLFHLEDAIGSQVIAALPASLREDQTAQAPTTTEQPSASQPQPYTSGPTVYDNGGYYDSAYTYPSGGYAYSYPSYDYYPSYSYPYYPYSYYPYGFYGSFLFFNNHDHHDHHDGHHDDHHDFHDGHHGDSHNGNGGHDGHGDFNHGWNSSNRSWNGSSSGRTFTGPTRSSPNFNRSTFGMSPSQSMRSRGFQSAPRSMGGTSRGFTGAGPTRSFGGGGMSRGFSGGGMSRGGGGGISRGGGGGGHGGGGHR
jgi:TolB-like protein